MRPPIPVGWLKEFMEFMKHRRLCQATLMTEVPGAAKVSIQCELPIEHKGHHQSHVEVSWRTEDYLKLE